MRVFLLLITISQCKRNDISSCDNGNSFSTDNEYLECSDQNYTFNTDELSDEEGTNLPFLIFLLLVMFLGGLLGIFSNGMVLLAHFKYRQGII